MSPLAPSGHGFGTLPVFLAAISTILGAIMFLRFGYAVGHVGLIGGLFIILLGHLVTVPTAMAISEISTNIKVEGGGEYFLISRSFGPRIGAAIGFALYLSQAISVGFYLIAFAQAFTPLTPLLAEHGIAFDARMASVPATLGLLALMLTKGADLGVKALYLVVATLAVSLVAFFVGSPIEGTPELSLNAHVSEPDSFFLVFAICFPAFTGMTAGVGLSGDLAKPSRSIPLGTMIGTIAGMLVYVAIVWKLSASASPEVLATDQLVMTKIAVWGPIVLIGLGAATLSSAIGSILVAPRTLQALAKDGAFPIKRMNDLFAQGVGESNEPRTATLFTGLLALVVVAAGDVDFVARLISMFFMVTYGSLCAISFLEHFAASPSYRPTFRSRWYVSLLGAVMCVLMMFQMDPVFALLSIAAMLGFYAMTGFTAIGSGTADLADLFSGVMGQANRWMQILLQRGQRRRGGKNWRPSIIAVSEHTFSERGDALELMSWLCVRQGFGMYLHHVRGMLDHETFAHSEELKAKLVEICRGYPGIYADAIVSPSRRSALAQVLQIPSVSGLDNNTVLIEFHAEDSAAEVEEVVDEAVFASATGKNLLVLRGGTPRKHRHQRILHVWLTWHDVDNANLMLLLAYIILGHPDWNDAEIRVFAAFPTHEAEEQERKFEQLVSEGRLPVNRHNLTVLRIDAGDAFRAAVEQASEDADLTILGLTAERLADRGIELAQRFPLLRQVLFVTAQERILIE
jgi:amino acid transporter